MRHEGFNKEDGMKSISGIKKIITEAQMLESWKTKRSDFIHGNLTVAIMFPTQKCPVGGRKKRLTTS